MTTVIIEEKQGRRKTIATQSNTLHQTQTTRTPQFVPTNVPQWKIESCNDGTKWTRYK